MEFLILGGILLVMVVLFYFLSEAVTKQKDEDFIQERKDRDGERD